MADIKRDTLKLFYSILIFNLKAKNYNYTLNNYTFYNISEIIESSSQNFKKFCKGNFESFEIVNTPKPNKYMYKNAKEINIRHSNYKFSPNTFNLPQKLRTVKV